MSTTSYMVVLSHDTKCIVNGMRKRYRYRTYPTGEQAHAIARLFGCVRVVWNDALATRERARKAGEPFIKRGELSALLTASKKTPERSWLTEVSSVPLQQSLVHLERAYTNFFNSLTGRRKGRRLGAPNFKRKSNRQSAEFTKSAGFSIIETTHGVGYVRLAKIGHVRFNLSRSLPSPPSSVALIQEPDGRYYVSFVVDVQEQALPATSTACGIDLGLTNLATVAQSNGERDKVENPRWMRTRQKKLAKAQRALSRKQKGSKNWHKARHQVASEHRKTRETRLDHHHKLALYLVRENQTICVEDLAISGLAKTRLAKSIHDAGWGILIRLLKEKADAYGREVITIDRWAPTSQTCAVCGAPGGKKPLNIRQWECSECLALLDRDYNASVNILVTAGLAETLTACGGSVRRALAMVDADPVKHEPTELLPA